LLPFSESKLSGFGIGYSNSLNPFLAKMILQRLLASSLSIFLVLAASRNAPDADCWKTLALVRGGPRQEHGVAAIGNSTYVVGGTKMFGTKRGQVNTVEVYDIKSNTWSDLPAVPVAMHHPNLAAVGGKLYILGALDGFVPTRKTLGNVYEYDPAVNKWEELAPMPKGTERGASAVAVNGNEIYIAGGLQPEMGDRDYGKNVVDIASKFDTVSRKWTSLPPLPGKRDHAGGAFIKDTFYVVGGRIGSVPSVQATVFSLNSTGKWASLTKMPTARGGLSAAAVGSKIYTFGGEGNPAPSAKGVFSNIESFDTVTGQWTKEMPMKVPRHGTQAATVGNAIYIPGGGLSGGGSQSVAIMEAYTPGSC
jgi:N-acetylneuraminic acid mutarotase